MSQLSTVQILRGWCDAHLLGITDDDVKAWQTLRNAVAHGKSLEADAGPDEFQETIDALARVENLINKLTLQATGYQEDTSTMCRGPIRTSTRGPGRPLENPALLIAGFFTKPTAENVMPRIFALILYRLGLATSTIYAQQFGKPVCFSFRSTTSKALASPLFARAKSKPSKTASVLTVHSPFSPRGDSPHFVFQTGVREADEDRGHCLSLRGGNSLNSLGPLLEQ